jgi:hypothetical protein
LSNLWRGRALARAVSPNSAEYFRICRGIKPPLLPDKPVAVDPKVNSEHLQLKSAPAERRQRGNAHENET